MSNIAIAFILTFIAGFSTLLGAIFILKKNSGENLVKYALAFAAGVMISVSFTDLIPEGIDLLTNEHNKNKSFVLLILFIIIGLLISTIIDKLIPENKDNVFDQKLYKVGIFSMIAIIVHNIPEGIATFLSSTANLNLGIALTIAITLHNIPEGISISVPVYKATKSRKKAIWYTFISGMSEPVGAILAFLILQPIINDTLMGIVLAIIAGIMIHISMFQLLPTSLKYDNKKKTLGFFVIGFLFMLISHLLLHH